MLLSVCLEAISDPALVSMQVKCIYWRPLTLGGEGGKILSLKESIATRLILVCCHLPVTQDANTYTVWRLRQTSPRLLKGSTMKHDKIQEIKNTE